MRRPLVNGDKRLPTKLSPSVSGKKSPRKGRSFGQGFVGSKRAVVALAAFAGVVLLGIHLYLFHSITKEGDEHAYLPLDLSNASPGHVTDGKSHFSVTPLRDVDLELYTIRINTWQRIEQLMVSIEHHASCDGVAQIQVVWCDEQGDPPQELEHYEKVVVERHTLNSLNERFHILQETPTMGILSIDDDVMRPCEAIDSGFFKWTRNPHRMVGFDARTHVENGETWAYGYMSTTEKSNRYSLSLPRYSLIHRDYLNSYMTDLPRPILNHVGEAFNCEDIAMSFFISSLTDGRPPLLADNWAMKSMVKLYSPAKISGTKTHKKLRDECVDSFAEQLGLKGVLQKGTIIHKQNHFFECGAPGDDDPHWRMVDRHAALEKRIHHWKHMKAKEAVEQVSKLRSHMIRHAYVLGLIADTKPWKERWKK